MNLFFDLDGTILEPAHRYFAAHKKALGDTKPVLTEESYWNLKREMMKEEKIIEQYYPLVDLGTYMKLRTELIESPETLKMDKPIPGAIETLKKLNEMGASLSLVTLRGKTENLLEEVKTLGIGEYFVRILTSHPGKEPWQTKADLMRTFAKPNDWMIGDTEADIKGGKLLNMKTCAVLSGIRTHGYLKELEPDHILKDLSEVVPLLS